MTLDGDDGEDILGDEPPEDDVPQGDTLPKVRDIVTYWTRPGGVVAAARRALALKPRDYQYHAHSARVLGFLERSGRSARVTARGAEWLQSEPGSQLEREILFSAIDCSPALKKVRAYLRGDEPLTRGELEARVSSADNISGTTGPRRALAMEAWRSYLTAADNVAPQLGLFETVDCDVNRGWPPMERFPHNRPNRQVAGVVLEDLLLSREALIVTGYASLSELLQLASRCSEATPRLRVIFGEEPFPTNKTRFVLGRNTFSDELREHWLERGISLRLSGAIIRTKQFLDNGRLTARIQGPQQELHAKIYVGDAAVTVGSSNFTDPGLRRKREGNSRFTRHGESKRYAEATDLAEIYWSGGVDFSRELHDLLDELLQKVTWQHALARACAELLEGRWATERYRLPESWRREAPLWPSQEQGIAQALWILENVGSVLIADAAGSGKTRMGAHLTAAVRRRLLVHGREGAMDPLIACPPDAVLEKWRDELAGCGMTATMPFSHGILSRASANDHGRAQHAIQRAPVVVVDEAHNFHNAGSNRTRAILGNLADHKILFTATPVSRPGDLLATVDLLGADNFDDEALDMMEQLLRGRARHALDLTKEETARLKTEIAKFTVRRTRSMLNAAIGREPERYCNDEGTPCRYPRHEPRFYHCDEPAEYTRVAREIRERAARLRGVLFLVQGLELPLDLADDGWDEAKFVSMRLRGARGLARYHVMAAFRSSRAALLEHVYGTAAAQSEFKLRGLSKAESGNVVGELRALDGPPTQQVSCELPDWLRDSDAHATAVAEEISIYEEIAGLVVRLPSVREDAKARVLADLAEKHQAVLAFDSRPITLADLIGRVRQRTSARVVLATGGDTAGRRQVTDLLQRNNDGDRVIALCSDSMAEGFNLQGASAVMHLDMPAVVRIAEQRNGRVDRMDSPHEAIEALWPKDPEEIALRADERLIANNEFVDRVLGANLTLPSDDGPTVVEPHTVVEELSRRGQDWDEDAFSPVRGLLEGKDRLVPAAIYEEVRTSRARLVSAVSVVRSARPWVFLAVGATERTAPRWVYFDAPNGAPVTSLGDVAAQLRVRLGATTEDADFDDAASDQLAEFLHHLQASERSLLPRQKQRALHQMEDTLRWYQSQTREDDVERHQALRELLRLVEPLSAFDLASVAACWLDAIRPTRYRWLQRRTKRKGFARLREIDRDLRDHPLTTEWLREVFQGLQGSRPLDERIVAVIIGIP